MGTPFMPSLAKETSVRHSSANLTIPLVHVSMLRTYVDFLSEIGNSVNRGLSHVGLPTAIVENFAGYLACRDLCEFVDYERRSQGIEKIGLRVIQQARSGLQRGTPSARHELAPAERYRSGERDPAGGLEYRVAV
jgi:hypothetical protein